MSSSGHLSTLIDRRFQHFGVGVAFGAPGRPGANAVICTVNFGYKR